MRARELRDESEEWMEKYMFDFVGVNGTSVVERIKAEKRSRQRGVHGQNHGKKKNLP